jgi:hypothetical protein
MTKPDPASANPSGCGWGLLALVVLTVLIVLGGQIFGPYGSLTDWNPFAPNGKLAGLNPFAPSKAEKAEETRRALEVIKENLRKEAANKNFSALKAGKVRIGMTKAEVIRSLGSTYKRERVTDPKWREHAEEQWLYGPESIVTFDYDGRVFHCTNNIDFDKR